MMKDVITFLPSFVGSKSYWIDDVRHITKGQTDFVELFAGSAVLSANCASTTFLCDIDPMICRILQDFNFQIVPEVFTREMYYKVRKQDDWWRYAFCLSRMAFSGVFRHTKNGFNVKAKDGKNYDEIRVRPQYEKALAKWRLLKPQVTCQSYEGINPESLEGKTVILDPPYEGSHAWGNWKQNLRTSQSFDYDAYWRYLSEVRKYASCVIVFDKRENLVYNKFSTREILFYKQRKMRVNGKYPAGVDAMIALTTLQ